MTRFASHGNEKALLEHRTDAASLLASHIDEEEPDILLIRYGEILVPSLNLVGEAAAAICKLICPFGGLISRYLLKSTCLFYEETSDEQR